MNQHRFVAALASLAALGVFLYLALTFVIQTRPDYGGSYTEGIVGSPMAANPLYAPFSDADNDLAALVYAGLTRLGPEGAVLPDLAERWDIDEQGRRYRFYLRPGVQWHDGSPFSAADVVYTIKLIQAPNFAGSPDLAALWKTVSVTQVDPLTVQMTLANPFAPFLRYTTLGILPAHINGVESGTGTSLPVGAGPFRVVEAVADRMTLVANPTHHFGRPYLDRIILRFYPDQPTALSALEQRQIQGVLVRPVLDHETVARLRSNGLWRAYSGMRPSYTGLFLNLTLPLFQDKAVRQALLYGLDRERIVRESLEGQAIVAGSPIPVGSWAYDSSISPYPYDQEHARQLMEEAGWSIGEGGVRRKGQQDLRFQLATTTDPARMLVAQEVARQWRELGVAADVLTAPPVTLLQDTVVPRRFQALLFGLDVGYDPDAYPVWHSSQRGVDSFNVASYSSAKADALLEQARLTTDEARRFDLYRQFQEVFAEDVPSLLLYYPVYSYFVDKSVRGIELGLLFEPSSRFANVVQWHIATKRLWFQRRDP